MCSDVDVGAQALESREDTTEMESPPMAELVDAPDSESGDESHASSRLAWGTRPASIGCLVQLAERRSPKPEVVGSRPAMPATSCKHTVRPHSSAGSSARLVSERSSVRSGLRAPIATPMSYSSSGLGHKVFILVDAGSNPAYDSTYRQHSSTTSHRAVGEPGRPREFHTLEIASSNLARATMFSANSRSAQTHMGRSPSWTKAPDFDSGNRSFESTTVCQ